MYNRTRELAFRIVNHWSLILTAFVSLVASRFVRQYPLQPTWNLESETNIHIAGITKDGRLITTERADAEEAIPWLCIRDVQTGQLQKEFSLESPHGIKRCVVTPDGRHAVTVDHNGSLKVVSLDDGHLRFPPLHGLHIDEVSPDSRYALIQLEGEVVIDLETGQIVKSFDGAKEFSDDSQRVLISRHTEGIMTVFVGDLRDGPEVSLGEVPQTPDSNHPERKYSINHSSWKDGRLYVAYRLPTHDDIGSEYRWWSYNMHGAQLNDSRFEPLLYGKQENSRVFIHSTFRNGHLGELRLHFPPTKGSPSDRLLEAIGWLGIQIGPWDTIYSWQPIDATTHLPWGSRIDGLTHLFTISPNGEWLVDHSHEQGVQLRGWLLPAYRNKLRWLLVGVASLVPIVLHRLLSRYRRRVTGAEVRVNV